MIYIEEKNEVREDELLDIEGLFSFSNTKINHEFNLFMWEL